MNPLSSDANFHYEAIRSLGLARYIGGDVGEQLAILPKIKPGDFESWYHEWYNLARRVLSSLDEHDSITPSATTLRDVYFRASHYFFVADFFLHGNRSDPRLRQSYNLWREYYDKGNAQLAIPGQHITVPTSHGFELPILVYRTAQAFSSSPRPTLLVGGGFDSNYEETMHVFGFAALERGFNVILYEGPGQPTLIHTQGVGFIHDWEKAVTPIVDHLEQHSRELGFIDTTKIGLVGMSMGGYLAARAAAFEPRLAAVMCIDGVWSMKEAFLAGIPGAKEAWEKGTPEAMNKLFAVDTSKSSTGVRWIHDHVKFSFCLDSGYDILQRASKMTLDGIADKITMPAFIGEAEDDLFFSGQPAQVVRGIGPNAKLVKFRKNQAAQNHCQSGALGYLNQKMLDWFGGVVGQK